MLNLTATDDVAVAKLQYSTDAGVTYIDIPITPGASVTAPHLTTRATRSRYRALDAAGNVSPGGVWRRHDDAQPGGGGRRHRRPARQHHRPRGRRRARDRHRRQPGDGQHRVDPVARAGLAEPERDAVAPLTKAHAAATVVAAVPAYRTIAVPIDTGRRPRRARRRWSTTASATAPRRSRRPARTRRRGSGSPAVRETWLDGTWVYPLPLDVSKLSLGKHTWALGVTDTAGNGNKVTLTFLVTTSFADIDALLARYGTAGTIPAATVTALRATLATAKTADTPGDKPARSPA